MKLAKVSGTTVVSYPLYLHDLRQEYKNVSFPAELTDEALANFGYAIVYESQQPIFDPAIDRVVEGTPIFDGIKWVEQWNIEALPPAAVPEAVSKLGLKYALGAQWATVKAAIDADPNLKEDWDLTYQIHRNSPLVNNTATALGFTDVQMDDIFRVAEQVVV